MKYRVDYSQKAQKNLRKLDPQTRKKILQWIDKNLVGTVNPREKGKALKGARAEQWRYRVGDYRVIAEIKDDEVIILVIEIGHRKQVYE